MSNVTPVLDQPPNAHIIDVPTRVFDSLRLGRHDILLSNIRRKIELVLLAQIILSLYLLRLSPLVMPLRPVVLARGQWLAGS